MFIMGCGDRYFVPDGDNNGNNESNLTDVQVLEDIIIVNQLNIADPHALGIQSWFDDRLIELQITNLDNLFSIPSTISNLDNLEKLILDNNRIVHVPYSICDLNINFLDSSKFSINGNFLCPNDVPACILQSINPVFQTCEWNSQDIGVLQDIINLNNLSVTAAELGATQFWNWGRLATLHIPSTEGYGIISELPESIYYLDSLQSIDLRQNQLQSLPENFGNLHLVEYLDLSSNQLQYLPESFGYMESLEYIDLTENNLSNLPESMVLLSHCEILDINFNNLEQLPEFITTLTSLQELNLAFNYITEIPTSISGLSGLDILDLYFNDLYFLPATLTSLSGLEVLDVGMNLIEYIPNNIGNMTGLDVLFLDGNQLTFLPESLCNLTLDFDDEWSFKIENNLLCIENVPECVHLESILGSQNCDDGF